MLRPRSVPTMLRHVAWRMKNLVRSQSQPESSTYRALEWFREPGKFRLSMLYRRAMARGRTLARSRPVIQPVAISEKQRPRGVSVVIPRAMGAIYWNAVCPAFRTRTRLSSSTTVRDDGTSEYLARSWPGVLIEQSPEPLAFAVAVNRGIRRARFSHVCVLNNDMVIEPGFFLALLRPF